MQVARRDYVAAAVVCVHVIYNLRHTGAQWSGGDWEICQG